VEDWRVRIPDVRLQTEGSEYWASRVIAVTIVAVITCGRLAVGQVLVFEVEHVWYQCLVGRE